MAIINRKSSAFKIISASIMVVIGIVMGKLFVDNWHKIDFSHLTINYWLLAASVIMSTLLSAIASWLWRYILLILGDRPSVFKLWRVNMYSQMFRYIPGRIWQYLGRVYWGKKLGLSEKNIMISTLLESIFLLSSAFAVSLITIKIYLPGHFLWVLSALMLALIIGMNPRILEKIINTLGRKWLSSPVVLKFSHVKILLLILLYCVQWIAIGLNFFIFVCSFYPLPWSQFPYFSSINAGSWFLGVISIVTPSGLGVKEGIFVFVFKQFVPVSFAILFAIMMRLFTVASEAIMFAVFFAFDQGAWKTFLEFKKADQKEKEQMVQP